jgi:hypothetical protein
MNSALKETFLLVNLFPSERMKLTVAVFLVCNWKVDKTVRIWGMEADNSRRSIALLSRAPSAQPGRPRPYFVRSTVLIRFERSLQMNGMSWPCLDVRPDTVNGYSEWMAAQRVDCSDRKHY